MYLLKAKYAICPLELVIVNCSRADEQALGGIEIRLCVSRLKRRLRFHRL